MNTRSVRKSIIGLKVGKLLVIERGDNRLVGKGKHPNVFYKCLCDCGNIKEINAGALRTKSTKSCGCGNANNRGYEFQISIEQFNLLCQQNCEYCGCQPNNTCKGCRSNVDYVYNGIDRVNNEIGYIYSNLVTCCSICNISKRAMSKESFLEWVYRVYNHSIIK